MKVVTIGGYLGSGKTTALMKICPILHDKYNAKIALIVNELGDVPVDGRIVEESELNVKEIFGGCICCTVAGTFQRTLGVLKREFNPDIVITEPTGVAIPHQLKLVAAMAFRDYKIGMGPAIILFDASRPEICDDEILGRLVRTQVEDADFVPLSKVDIASEEDIQKSIQIIREVNKNAEIFRFSSVTGEGVDRMIEIIIEAKDYPIPEYWGTIRK